MKYVSWCLAVLPIGALAWWTYESFFDRPEIVPSPGIKNPFGHYLVDGDRNASLHIELGVPGAPPGGELSMQAKELGMQIEVVNAIGNELCYVDAEGYKWCVPKGAINDGASVPMLLQSFIAGGLNTQAKYAAIVHDRYCALLERKQAPQDVTYLRVHRMFYGALRCSHVEPRKALIMYVAVVKFGPPHDRSPLMRLFANRAPNAKFTSEALEAMCHAREPNLQWFRKDGVSWLLRKDDLEAFERVSTRVGDANVRVSTATQGLANIERVLSERANQVAQNSEVDSALKMLRDRTDYWGGSLTGAVAMSVAEAASIPSIGSARAAARAPVIVPTPATIAETVGVAGPEEQLRQHHAALNTRLKDAKLDLDEAFAAQKEMRAKFVAQEDENTKLSEKLANEFLQVVEQIDTLPVESLTLDAIDQMIQGTANVR